MARKEAKNARNGEETKMTNEKREPLQAECRFEIYGQASRTISTGKLNASPRLHTRPINLVISQGPLATLRWGIPHLEGGFALICLQRLSFPNTATRRCPWRDNRNTGGSSFPVLSY